MNSELTFFEALLQSLERAGNYNSGDQSRPTVILWTDKERQWDPLAERLLQALPHFLIFGDYAPGSRMGPAIWLRCMLGHKLPDATWPDEAIPVIYLPGVSRQELRAVDECPQHLQTLAALQYEGVFFTQVNARDWTITAFLQTKDNGLGLVVSRDTATLNAMQRSLLKLADMKVDDLKLVRLDADFFNHLLNPDAKQRLLLWLNDPVDQRKQWDDNEWKAFCDVCRKQYGFDPERDGALAGAEYLGLARDERWRGVWARFAEAPARYRTIPDLLRRAKPSVIDDLFYDHSTWPQDNESEESELRSALLELGAKPLAEARVAIHKLEKDHGERRGWAWATLGVAPLAIALEHLTTLAKATEQPLGGVTLEQMVSQYLATGWQADAAVLDALAIVSLPHDVAAVRSAILAIYRPWLEATAEVFQAIIQSDAALPQPKTVTRESLPAGTCILFADGLRLDMGKKLSAALIANGMQVKEDWSLAALPTVTATAKPAIAPLGPILGPGDGADDFTPSITGQDRPLNFERFKQLLTEQGFEFLAPDATGSLTGAAWTEYGKLDRSGHSMGWQLAHLIAAEIDGLAHRILSLLSAGWREVRVVTDHGWLLLPGGLPKVDLPGYLAISRWGRCALIKDTATVVMPVVSWYWDKSVRVATPPGIGCFVAGKEYEHGGLSLQECIIPLLTVTLPAPVQKVIIENVKWVGLRCRVQLAGETGLMVDLRTKINDPATSLSESVKATGTDGTCLWWYRMTAWKVLLPWW